MSTRWIVNAKFCLQIRMSGVGDQKKVGRVVRLSGGEGLVGDTGRMFNVCLAFRQNLIICSRNLHHKLLGERRIKSGSGSDVRYSSGRHGERVMTRRLPVSPFKE